MDWNCGKCETAGSSVFFCGAAKSWKRHIARCREHVRGFWATFFVAELPQKKRCFSIQEFTRFLLTGVVTASSQALWRILSNKVIWDDDPCTSAQNTCKVHVTLTAKNAHICIPTHICICIHTHAHAWHRPHAEALIPRPTIYAQT